MKVIIIGPAHPLRGGGITTFNERLVRQFQNEGHQTSIYSFSLQYPGFLFPGKSQFTNEPAPTDIEIHTRINSVNPFNWISVGNEIKKIQPDIVVVRFWIPLMGPCLGTILRIIKKNRHTKIICIADNIIPHEKRFGDKAFTSIWKPPLSGRWRRGIMRQRIGWLELVITFKLIVVVLASELNGLNGSSNLLQIVQMRDWKQMPKLTWE